MWLDNIVFIIAIVMVFEGILPFLAPQQWKRMLFLILTVDDKKLRRVALASMLIGVFLLYVVDPTF